MSMSAAAIAPAGMPSTSAVVSSSGVLRLRHSGAKANATSAMPSAITTAAMILPCPVAVVQALTAARKAATASPMATSTQTTNTLPSRAQTLSGTGSPVPSSSGRATARTR